VRALLGGRRRAGLTVALDLLKEIADKYEGVSYADLFQLASATAIEARGPAAAAHIIVARLARACMCCRIRPGSWSPAVVLVSLLSMRPPEATGDSARPAGLLSQQSEPQLTRAPLFVRIRPQKGGSGRAGGWRAVDPAEVWAQGHREP